MGLGCPASAFRTRAVRRRMSPGATVGAVQADHVDTRPQEAGERPGFLGVGPDGGDDLRAAERFPVGHRASPRHVYGPMSRPAAPTSPNSRTATRTTPRREDRRARPRDHQDLGLKPELDPNLVDTDLRVAKMYLDIFSGLDEGTRPKLTTFPNQERYTAMVMEKEIPFYSMCSHHFVPFYGHGHIAYNPNERMSASRSSRASSSFSRGGPSSRSGSRSRWPASSRRS